MADSITDFISDINNPELFHWIRDNYPPDLTWELLSRATRWERKHLFSSDAENLYNTCYSALQKTKFAEKASIIADKWVRFILSQELDASMLFMYSPSKEFFKHLQIKGKEYLDQCLNSNKGFLIVCPHFGSFYSLSHVLSALNVQQVALSNGGENEHLTKVINILTPEASNNIHEVIPVTSVMAVRKAIRYLNKGISVVIFPEFTVGEKPNSFVNYFGHKIPAALGTERMSELAKVPILPTTLIHENPDSLDFSLEFYKPFHQHH